MAQPNAKRRQESAAEEALRKEPLSEFPLTRLNFRLMIIAAAVIVLGFLLMLGGSSTPDQFNPDIFSTRRVVVGPTIAFLGFLFMGFAIIFKKKKKSGDADAEPEA